MAYKKEKNKQNKKNERKSKINCNTTYFSPSTVNISALDTASVNNRFTTNKVSKLWGIQCTFIQPLVNSFPMLPCSSFFCIIQTWKHSRPFVRIYSGM